MVANLNLVDWSLVGYSALWILGLALILATLSQADYAAAQKQMRLSAILRQAGPRISLDIGLVLFCLGLLGTSGALWERLAWAGLAVWFVVQTWRAGRDHGARRRQP